MNKLLKYRKKLNLTQEELAEKAGVSARTIQRIEKGTEPKGHTLKALAKALEINESNLKESKQEAKAMVDNVDHETIKWINLSSLPFVFVPLASIALPLAIMFVKKQFNPITKQIISLQILWFVVSVVLFFLIALFVKNGVLVPFLCSTVLLNVFVILRNAAALDKNKRLHIKLNFNLI